MGVKDPRLTYQVDSVSRNHLRHSSDVLFKIKSTNKKKKNKDVKTTDQMVFAIVLFLYLLKIIEYILR